MLQHKNHYVCVCVAWRSTVGCVKVNFSLKLIISHSEILFNDLLNKRVFTCDDCLTFISLFFGKCAL